MTVIDRASRARRDRRAWRVVAFALLATLLPAWNAGAQAGVISSIASVPMSAVKSNGLSLLVNSGSTQSLFGLTDGAPNTFATPVSITTTWDLHPSVGALSVVAYFTAPAQALTNGSDAIPAAWMKGRMVTGTPVTFTAFTQNAVSGTGSAGGSLLLYSFSIKGNNRTGSRTDNLELQLDLTGQAPLTPGTYSGTLNIRAVAQ